MTHYLLDANIVIYALTGQFPAMRRHFEERAPGDLAISSVTFAEVAMGVARGKPPVAADFEAFVAVNPVLPFDELAARAYASLPFQRARFDRLLAAHALSLGVVVVTNNEADFAGIPSLKLENWTL